MKVVGGHDDGNMGIMPCSEVGIGDMRRARGTKCEVDGFAQFCGKVDSITRVAQEREPLVEQ